MRKSLLLKLTGESVGAAADLTPAEIQASVAAQAKRCFALGYVNTLRHLRAGSGGDQVAEQLGVGAIVAARSIARQVYDSMQQAHLPACKQGCSACCVSPIETTVPEVASMAQALRESLDPAALSSLRQRLDGPATDACALLLVAGVTDHAGSCSVHKYRPIACVMQYASDARDCSAHRRDPSTQVRFTASPRIELATMWMGLVAAIERHGLKPARVDLTRALAVALDRPDAGKAWASGDESVFAACAVPDAMLDASELFGPGDPCEICRGAILELEGAIGQGDAVNVMGPRP